MHLEVVEHPGPSRRFTCACGGATYTQWPASNEIACPCGRLHRRNAKTILLPHTRTRIAAPTLPPAPPPTPLPSAPMAALSEAFQQGTLPVHDAAQDSILRMLASMRDAIRELPRAIALEHARAQRRLAAAMAPGLSEADAMRILTEPGR